MLSSGRISDRKQPEKQKFLSWYEKYDKDITSEEVYRELNEINAALESGKYEVVAEVNEEGVFIHDKEFF